MEDHRSITEQLQRAVDCIEEIRYIYHHWHEEARNEIGDALFVYQFTGGETVSSDDYESDLTESESL